MTIQVPNIPWEADAHKIDKREFTQTGDQRYRMVCLPVGIIFEVDRLRRERHELTGELSVKVNGNFLDAKKYGDDLLTVGDLNFSSVQARSTRSKLIAERAGASKVDWFGVLEDFAARIVAAERKGKPAEILADVEPTDENTENWMVETFPVLRFLPMVLFGDSGSGKSYFAIWLAGKLCEMGVNVMYADWELASSEHRKRLGRLFQPMPKNLFYTRCERSLKHDAERLTKQIETYKIQYAICDSIGFAVDGPAESHEAASEYFRAIRQLGVGTLSVAHIPKQNDDSREAQIYGSTFFKAGARSIWFIDAAQENPKGELRFGLYQRKNNLGARLAPRGYKLLFEGARTRMEEVSVSSVAELAASLPLIDRLKRILGPGPKKLKDVADTLAVSQDAARKALTRHGDVFVKIGMSYGLRTDRPAIGRSEEF